MAPSRAPVHNDVKAACVGLEGDGVCDKFFELLWKRDLFSDSALALQIPDTVIFKFGAPSVWFFTSVDGTIKRKTKAKVNSETIFEDFTKKGSSSGIVGCYVYNASPETDTPADPSEKDAHVGPRTTMEYLTRDDLWHVMFNRQRSRPDGILQKFVEPKEDRNNMIRVMWSPKVCLLERRVNNKRLSDTKFDVYERAVTFEGSDFLSTVTPVRGRGIVMQVHDVADDIVQHIAAVTGDRAKINRMALNFKVDDRDRLWLMFPSSIRLKHDSKMSKLLHSSSGQLTEATAILQIPEHVRRIGTTQCSRPAALQCTSRCPTCEQKVESGGLCDVSYKVIIEYEETRRGATQPLPVPLWPQLPPGQAASPSSTARPGETVLPLEVPEPLQKLHPRLTCAEYSQFRHDVTFLYKSASVCEACYLDFSAPQLGANWRQTVAKLEGAECEELEIPMATIKALDPGRLRKREQATRRRVLEQKAAEDERDEEMLRCRLEKHQMERAQSCPKLVNHGHLVKPPAAVLESRPDPPRGAAPLWVDMRPGRASPHLQALMSPQRRRKVAPLLGAPYLKDLQDFALKCPDRAAFIVPTIDPNRGQRAQALQRTASAPSAAPVPEVHWSQQEPAQRPKEESPEALRQRTASAASDIVEVAEDHSDDGVVDLDEKANAEDPLMAKLWEQWPKGATSGAGSASTTRPPSAADGSTRPSSGFRSYATGTNSRNSSKAGSRLQSAHSASRKSPANGKPQSALRRSPSSQGRPLSSPLTRGAKAGMESERRLQRPNSSPQIRLSGTRPPPVPEPEPRSAAA